MSRSDPVEAGRSFIASEFPDALAAFVAGSFHSGVETPTSDLDIVILANRPDAPYRAAFRSFGWPNEVFVHTEESIYRYFADDAARPMPSLPMMCREGTIVADRDGMGTRIRAEATALLDQGPDPLTADQLNGWRYALTDVLDDFRGVADCQEGIFIVAELAKQATDLILLHHRRWIGHGKWLPRVLRAHDPMLAERLFAAMDAYLHAGEKEPMVSFAERALSLDGGPLFEGYYQRARPLHFGDVDEPSRRFRRTP